MAKGKRSAAQTTIIGRRQATIGGGRSGWFFEPRRHRDAALKGKSRHRAGTGAHSEPFKTGAPPPAPPRPPEHTPVQFERRYDDLRAPPSELTLPKYTGGDYYKRGQDASNVEDWMVKDGFITEGPGYTDHKRGKNWLATIEADPTAPGGLHRDFIQRGNGEYMYRNSLDLGDVYEVGADYYSSSGRKDSRREYGVVIENRDGRLKTLRFEKPAEAIAFSRELKNAIEWAKRS